MAVSAVCQQCKKQQEPYLDPKTEKIYCSLCDQEMIANHFLKIQLKTLKQYKQKAQIPFSVKCQKCQTEDQPILIKQELSCPKCKNAHKHLSEPFKILLKEKIK